jgi:hypothetical protein
MHVLVNAIPFGYGPVSKARSVVRELLARDIECTFCGSGVAYEFMSREAICEVRPVDLYTPAGQRELGRLSAQIDYGLTTMEPLFVKHAAPDLPIGYIDSLPWMWDSQHFIETPELCDVTHYFVQNTFDAGACMAARVRNPVFVGSVVELPKLDRPASVNRAVIHFGGVENIYMPLEQIYYPCGAVAALSTVPSLWKSFAEVLVVSGRRTAERLSARWPGAPVRFQSIAHDEFLHTVATSSLLITTPGLTMLLEAFALGVPALFLPPQNYSQYLILEKLREAGYPEPLLNWPGLVPGFRVAPDAPEEVAVAEIGRTIDTFFKTPVRLFELARCIEERLVGRSSDAVLKFQRRFIEQIGCDGASAIARVVARSGARMSDHAAPQ